MFGGHGVPTLRDYATASAAPPNCVMLAEGARPVGDFSAAVFIAAGGAKRSGSSPAARIQPS